MLPVEIKQNFLAKRREVYNDQKMAILQSQHVQLKLSENELIIAQTGIGLSIKQANEKELISAVAVASKFICRDVGIRTWDNKEVMKYDAVRFFNILRRYYNDLTFSEVKMAFELALVGQLDEWLPKDRNGEPDKNHYQSFSLEYITKILNAYKSKKNKIWFKARKSLPVPITTATKEEKEMYRKAFLNDIYIAFDAYVQHGKRPRFILNIFIKEFVNQGLIKEVPPAKSLAFEAAKLIAETSIDKKERKAVKDQYDEMIKSKMQNVGDMLLNRAQNIQNNTTISEIFDDLVQQKKDIRTVIK